MLQRFLNPSVLAGISGLELVARTVVDGFVSGLHRSPDFGFSQEFAEYRAYVPGDDLRYVDWNAYARTERLYLKKYRGETNTRLTLLLDRSGSMGFKGKGVRKIDYARFLGASLAYLAHQQRDAVGLISFGTTLSRRRGTASGPRFSIRWTVRSRATGRILLNRSRTFSSSCDDGGSCWWCPISSRRWMR
jgi:uncharacterized protein (DUF58 family)